MKEIRIIAVILGLLASVMAVAQDGALAKEGNKLRACQEFCVLSRLIND
jgi:hypothetical protein